ncbi:hypothetical protein E4T38_08563 [Aureobasidium subglaciale]|nr:hypothetical protein E4T38_08563 [Aureobasidium subglaciale]KAI5215105.1 hypothetical protein E4T40_08576 [Aureobasidium subglaciale]KAI5218326.1 hypothetical protein E4T41_08429 [Aureobasidium subglaciale]
MLARQARRELRSEFDDKPTRLARTRPRVRTTTQFADPDYNQPTPMPKSAALSPTWANVHKIANGRQFHERVKVSDLDRYVEINKTANQRFRRGDHTNFVIEDRPSASRTRSKDISSGSFCAEPSISPMGDFQDRIARFNFARAQAMASPQSFRRSASRPKRVVILDEYWLDDDKQRRRVLSSPSWRKTRPDTPSSTRSRIFDFASDSRILTTVCAHLGNPAALDCDGNSNLTIKNVLDHCHDTAGRIYDSIHMASVKASLDDVVQSCKGTASSYASEKFEDVKAVRGDLKEALCKLSGSEELVDCVRKPASKLSNAYEMVGSVVTSPFGSKQTGSSRASPAPTAEAGTRQYAQSTTSSHAEVVVHDFVISLVYDLSSTVESKYASAQSKLSSVKPRMSSIGSTIRSNAHSIMDQLISPDKHETSSDTASPMPSLAGSSMYEAIESVSSLKDLELQYDLAFAKTYLHLLRDDDSSIKAHTERARRQMQSVMDKLRQVNGEIDEFMICIAREPSRAIQVLSREVSYEPQTGSRFSLTTSRESITPEHALATLRRSARCHKHVERVNVQLEDALKIRERLRREIDRLTDISHRRDFARTAPLYFRPTRWAPPVGPFPALLRRGLPPLSAFNSVNIFYWNVYLKRSEEEREQGLRLNRLRAALSQIRASCHAFDEMKVLAERGHDSFVTAKHYIDNHEAMVKSDPVSGPTFLREQLEVIKNELKSSDRALGERKRLKEQIRRNAWTQNENATDVVAPWVIKELQL